MGVPTYGNIVLVIEPINEWLNDQHIHAWFLQLLSGIWVFYDSQYQTSYPVHSQRLATCSNVLHDDHILCP